MLASQAGKTLPFGPASRLYVWLSAGSPCQLSSLVVVTAENLLPYPPAVRGPPSAFQRCEQKVQENPVEEDRSRARQQGSDTRRAGQAGGELTEAG